VEITENCEEFRVRAKRKFLLICPTSFRYRLARGRLNPMEGIYSGVTRKSITDKTGDAWLQNESLSIEKAIECYTLGSAYASFEEEIKGFLKEGKLADIVVLSKDGFTIPEEEILNTDVVYPILGGKIIYS